MTGQFGCLMNANLMISLPIFCQQIESNSISDGKFELIRIWNAEIMDYLHVPLQHQRWRTEENYNKFAIIHGHRLQINVGPLEDEAQC
jgi:hypothetical protein